MTDYEQIFLSSGQEKQKLAIALKRFAEVSEPDWQNRYQSYLRTRFRPAMTELIHSGDLERIRRLCSFACSSDFGGRDSERCGFQPYQGDSSCH